jgi:hypothetical protein
MVILLASASFSDDPAKPLLRSDQIDWHLRNPLDLSQAIAMLSYLLKSVSIESVKSRLLDAAALGVGVSLIGWIRMGQPARKPRADSSALAQQRFLHFDTCDSVD